LAVLEKNDCTSYTADMNKLLKQLRNITQLLLLAVAWAEPACAGSMVVARWGNAVYVDMAMGESQPVQYKGIASVSQDNI
jgi:hypothetical protein